MLLIKCLFILKHMQKRNNTNNLERSCQIKNIQARTEQSKNFGNLRHNVFVIDRLKY